MAKKKHKLTKKQRLSTTRALIPVGWAVCGVVIGVLITIIVANYHSDLPINNLIWAADNTVKIPEDLRKSLILRDDCRHYKGVNSPRGIGLWGVYQVSHKSFAKIAYGCSWNLSSYIMAVKQGREWILVPPTDYFAAFKDSPSIGNGALPKCSQLEKYHIDKTIEPFCILTDGSAKANEL